MFLPTLARGAVLVVSQQSSFASDKNPGTEEKPMKTISAAAAKVHAGDRVVIHRGEYRETVIVKNSGTKEAPIVLEAAAGEAVVIKGSEVIKKWTRATSNAWTAKIPLPPKLSAKSDEPAFWNTNDVRQVFLKDGLLLDAVRLHPVAAKEKLQPGGFFFDRPDSTLYLWLSESDDPDHYKIEASVRGAWLLIFGDYVMVRGLQMRHASTLAIANWPACDIYGKESGLENCAITWGDFAGISLSGKGNRLVDCLIACHGNSGIGGTGEGHLIERCRVLYNNMDRYDPSWHCGGAKLIPSFSKSRIVANEFAYNLGPGLWLDDNCAENRIERNFCHENEGSGIMVETSPRNQVLNNICVANRNSSAGTYLSPDPEAGKERPGIFRGEMQNEQARSTLIYQGGGGVGIFISSAPQTKIYNNTCWFNEGGGITVEGPRRDSSGGPVSIRDCAVRNNISVYNKGPQLMVRKNEIDPDTRGNSSDHNLLLAIGSILAKNGWAGETAFSIPEWQRISKQDEHSREGDPHFVLATMGDFRLQPDSMALHAGETLPEIKNDFFGQRRPDTPISIGACETASLDFPKPPIERWGARPGN